MGILFVSVGRDVFPRILCQTHGWHILILGSFQAILESVFSVGTGDGTRLMDLTAKDV